MQVATPAATPSKQQAEACKAAPPVPVSQMLSVQQVEAQQAAQQLLQGQQQSALPADDGDDGAFGSVQMVAPTASQHDSAHDSQVRQALPTQAHLIFPAASSHPAWLLYNGGITFCCACVSCPGQHASVIAMTGDSKAGDSPHNNK